MGRSAGCALGDPRPAAVRAVAALAGADLGQRTGPGAKSAACPTNRVTGASEPVVGGNRFRGKPGRRRVYRPVNARRGAVTHRRGSSGLILQSVDRRTATLQKSGQRETLKPATCESARIVAGRYHAAAATTNTAPNCRPGRRPAPRMHTRAVWLSNAYGIAFAWRSRVGGFATGRYQAKCRLGPMNELRRCLQSRDVLPNVKEPRGPGALSSSCNFPIDIISRPGKSTQYPPLLFKSTLFDCWTLQGRRSARRRSTSRCRS